MNDFIDCRSTQKPDSASVGAVRFSPSVAAASITSESGETRQVVDSYGASIDPEAIAYSLRTLGDITHEQMRALLESMLDLLCRQTWGDHSCVIDDMRDALSNQGLVTAYSDDELAEIADSYNDRREA